MPQTPSSQRAREIFEEALEAASESERADILAKACGIDAGLRARVEQLLRAHDAAESFLPDVPPSPEVDSLNCEKPGDRVGRYKLLQKIGDGGCGVVYMAEQEQPVRRRVALKVIKLGMDTKSVVARFEAERQALAMMDHPNIATVLDAGATEAGRPFFVMELVNGLRITQFCDENQLSARERLDLFLKVCHAIQHAHQKGIIHRDIKPSNILVTLHDGVPVPKVIDFGIAKATEARLTEKTLFTQFHALIGTPAYMSPEQAEPSGLDVDTRTDIYSLGVLLYELLTGETPFDANALLQAGLDKWRRTIQEVEPVRPSTRVLRRLTGAGGVAPKGRIPSRTAGERRDLSLRCPREKELIHLLKGDLDWIVMKCLEKDRTRRYETANALGQDVRCYLENEPVTARPPSRRYLFRKMVRRNRGPFAALAAIAILLVLGVAVSSWQAVRARKAERAERDLRQQAERNERATREAREHERLRAYTSDMKSAASALHASNFGQTVDLLSRYFPQPGDRDLRGIEWRYLWQAARGDEVRSFPQNHFVNCVRISPSGQVLAAASFGGKVRLIDANSGKAIAAVDGLRDSDATDTIAFSTDGKYFAVCMPEGIAVRDADDWKIHCTLAGPAEGLAFSPDGQILAVNGHSDFRLYGTQEWNLRGRIATTASGTGCLAFAANGQQLAVIRRAAPSVTIWDVATQHQIAEFGPIELPTCVAGSPDGRFLAVGNSAGELSIYDLAERTQISKQRAHSRWVFALAFSPDGETLATGGGDQVIQLWDTSTVSAPALERRATLKGHRSELWSLAFSSDGTQLISGSKDATVKCWSAHPPPDPNIPFTVRGGTLALGFMPNTKQFVMLSSNGELQLWDVIRGQILKSVPVEPMGAVLFNTPKASFGTTNGTVETWEMPTGERVGEVRLNDGPIMALGVSPDKRFFLGWDKMREMPALWNLESGERLAAFPDFATTVAPGSWSKSQRVAFSPDNRWLAYASSGYTITLWDLQHQREGSTLRGHAWHVECLRFSPDSSLLASGSWDAEARLWDPSTGLPIGSPLKGHLSGIGTVSFSPDGRTLAARSGEDLHFWSILNGADMLTIPKVTVWFFNIISPDGNAMIWEDGAFTGRFQVHYLPTLTEIDRAKSIQGN